MKKILVTGGRDYADHGAVSAALSPHIPCFIIQGGARGADALAATWARDNGMPYAEVPAHWTRLGKRAGPVRNRWMLLLEPDVVIAFPGGQGTADMVAAARKASIPVVIVGQSDEG